MSSDAGIEEYASKAGVQNYVSKPLDFEVLLDVLKKLSTAKPRQPSQVTGAYSQIRGQI